MMLLSAVAGLAGCSSGNGSVYGKVSPDSEKKIGNAKRNGVEIVIPAGTFENGDKIYILIGFVGGNNTISTAYEYKWHS